MPSIAEDHDVPNDMEPNQLNNIFEFPNSNGINTADVDLLEQIQQSKFWTKTMHSNFVFPENL